MSGSILGSRAGGFAKGESAIDASALSDGFDEVRSLRAQNRDLKIQLQLAMFRRGTS